MIRRSSLAGTTAAVSICGQRLFFVVLISGGRTCQWCSNDVRKPASSLPGVIRCTGVNCWRNGVASDDHDIACTGNTKFRLWNILPLKMLTIERWGWPHLVDVKRKIPICWFVLQVLVDYSHRLDTFSRDGVVNIMKILRAQSSQCVVHVENMP